MRCVREVNPTMSDWKMQVCGRFHANLVAPNSSSSASASPAASAASTFPETLLSLLSLVLRLLAIMLLFLCSTLTTAGGSMLEMSAAHRRCSHRRRNSFTKLSRDRHSSQRAIAHIDIPLHVINVISEAASLTLSKKLASSPPYVVPRAMTIVAYTATTAATVGTTAVAALAKNTKDAAKADRSTRAWTSARRAAKASTAAHT
mmetsp:Transcript_13797/g.22570  ORF Transcript_13797/g.22570 Transcript_13797/m.22570 type:complete len:203 (-) Transcript_13797:2843-3451(-)